MRTTASQLVLALPQRGGKRRGAGRKPIMPGRRVSHKARPRFDKAAAVHVTLRVADHVWNLRSRRCFKVLEACVAAALGRSGLRVIDFTPLGKHLHFLVEADSSRAPPPGMQGLFLPIPKAPEPPK